MSDAISLAERATVTAMMLAAGYTAPQARLAASYLAGMTGAYQSGVQDGVSQVLQRYGLPKVLADDVAGVMSRTMGDRSAGAGQATDAQTSDAMQALKEYLAQAVASDLEKELEQTADAGGSTGKKGWLRALAAVLGKIANDAADELKKMGASIVQDDPKALTEYQAASQEFSMLMNTITNAIKTIGEGDANVVRKT